MAEKPTTLPEWATDGGAAVAEPSAGKKQTGWEVDEQPPAHWFNWLFELIYNWMQYLDAPTGTGAGDGFEATGGPTDGTGLRGTGGGTNGRGIQGDGKGTGAGVYGTSSGTGDGVVGVGTGGGRGVSGTNNGATAGVRGENTSTGPGVAARTDAGTGHAIQLTGNTTTAPFATTVQTQPSSQAAGDAYASSVDDGTHVSNGTRFQRVNSVVLNYVEDPAAGTAADQVSDADGAFATVYSIPANSLRVGSVIRARAVCVVDGEGGSASDAQIEIRIGGTTYAAQNMGTFGVANKVIVEAEAIVHTIGASGKLWGSGVGHTNAGAASFTQTNGDTSFDTTAANSVQVYVDFTTPSAGDDVGLYQFSVEVI